MSRTASLLLALLLLTTALVPAFAAKDKAAVERKAREDCAKLLLAHVEWCAKNGARDEGAHTLDEARALLPDADGLESAAAALTALPEDAGAGPDKAVLERQRKSAGPKIAKAYEKLAESLAAPAPAAATDLLVRGLSWDPAPARLKRVVSRVKDAGKGDPDEAGRLLSALRRADADGAAKGDYDSLEADLAKDGIVLLSSPVSPLVGYVSLPNGWKKGGAYPVLVAVDGAGSNFLGCAKNFSGARGARDVIVLAPVTLSNTNALEAKKYPHYTQALLDEWNAKRLDFDQPGIDGLLQVLRERYGAEEKVFLTGFSGGGLYTYYELLQHPDRVAGAAPACANFGGSGVQGAPGAGEGGGPPVHLFTGELDPHKDDVFGQKPGIEGQTDLIEGALAKLGYTHVERTQVKGAKHSALTGEVWKFVDQVLDAR